MVMASVMGVFGLIIYLFLIMLPIALLVALQVWLCKKGPRLGLILPGLSLALSLVLVFSMAAFTTVSGGGNVLVSGGASYVGPDGQEVPAQETTPGGEQGKAPSLKADEVLAVGLVFLVTNIPTVVYGGIWLHYKGRRDTVEDLRKMRIEDLG